MKKTKTKTQTVSANYSDSSAVAILVSAVSFFGLFLCTVIGLNFLYQDLPRVLNEPAGTITVEGTGEVLLKPDKATVNVGLMVQDPSIEAAQNKAKSKLAEIKNALSRQAISESDIKTQYYSVNVNYDWNSPERTLTGYTSNHSLTITVNDVEKVDKVLEAMASVGQTSINGVNFTVKDDTKKEAQVLARAKALANVEAQAKELAGLYNRRLGTVKEIKMLAPQNMWNGYDGHYESMGGGGGETLMAGEVRVSQSVMAEFDLLARTQ